MQHAFCNRQILFMGYPTVVGSMQSTFTNFTVSSRMNFHFPGLYNFFNHIAGTLNKSRIFFLFSFFFSRWHSWIVARALPVFLLNNFTINSLSTKDALIGDRWKTRQLSADILYQDLFYTRLYLFCRWVHPEIIFIIEPVAFLSFTLFSFETCSKFLKFSINSELLMYFTKFNVFHKNYHLNNIFKLFSSLNTSHA